MKQRTFQFWGFVHKWSSLVCTLFILLLCVTGLPLIFHEEIDHMFGPELEEAPEVTAAPTLDSIVARASAQRPGEVVAYLFFDPHAPIIGVASAPSPASRPQEFYYQAFDARTGQKLDMPQPNEGFMYIMLKLHVDLFAGLPGMLFLGLMGLLLLLAIVSGVVLYAPFMRKLDFGAVRANRGRHVRWLDLHNLLGIVTVIWLGVVGLTGVINTLGVPVQTMWQSSELVQMSATHRDRPVPDQYAPVDEVAAAVLEAQPQMRIRTIAFPGTPFASPHHYGVYLVGQTPVTSRLLTPALVDAVTGELTALREMPLYVKVFFLSQPLHFGDYGGLPLKIAWAVLDLMTIVVLITGLYLWFKKSRFARRAARAESEADVQANVQPELEEVMT